MQQSWRGWSAMGGRRCTNESAFRLGRSYGSRCATVLPERPAERALMPSHIAVVGAGLAGLSAAIALTQAGKVVTLIEAGPAAGGRCRSYFDRELGLRIDNGNHLLLSGNHAVFGYLNTVGAIETLVMPAEPVFPFMDLRDRSRWVLRPNLGSIPWWVLSRTRRVPGTRVRDHLALLRLRKINSDASVHASMPHDTLYERLVQPLAVAALNTP